MLTLNNNGKVFNEMQHHMSTLRAEEKGKGV